MGIHVALELRLRRRALIGPGIFLGVGKCAFMIEGSRGFRA